MVSPRPICPFCSPFDCPSKEPHYKIQKAQYNPMSWPGTPWSRVKSQNVLIFVRDVLHVGTMPSPVICFYIQIPWNPPEFDLHASFRPSFSLSEQNLPEILVFHRCTGPRLPAIPQPWSYPTYGAIGNILWIRRNDNRFKSFTIPSAISQCSNDSPQFCSIACGLIYLARWSLLFQTEVTIRWWTRSRWENKATTSSGICMPIVKTGSVGIDEQFSRFVTADEAIAKSS